MKNKLLKKLDKDFYAEFQGLPTLTGALRGKMIFFINSALKEQEKEMITILEDVLRYVNHYQELLNDYDGGDRKGFKSVEKFLAGLKRSEEQ